MKTLCVWTLVCALPWISSCAKESHDDGLLEYLAERLMKQPATAPCPLAISAHAVQGPEGPYLAFSMTNSSIRKMTFFNSSLPWGNPGSLRLAALRVDGSSVFGVYPIADPIYNGEVTIEPGQTSRGQYDLEQIWSPQSDLDSALPTDQPVIILWAYSVDPLEFQDEDPRPICSGVTAFRSATEH